MKIFFRDTSTSEPNIFITSTLEQYGYLPDEVAGNITNSIVEQLKLFSWYCKNFFVFFLCKFVSYLRGSDEKEVLSNDITCKEVIHLRNSLCITSACQPAS